MSEPRYRLRADAFFVQTDGGVSIRNNRGSMSIDGRAAYPLVKHLFAALQRGATMDELCRGVSERQRPAIEGIVRRFEQHGFCRPAGASEEIPAWAEALYGAPVAAD